MAKKGRPTSPHTPTVFSRRLPAPKKHITYCGRGNVFCFAFIHTALSLVEAAGLADWALVEGEEVGLGCSTTVVQ